MLDVENELGWEVKRDCKAFDTLNLAVELQRKNANLPRVHRSTYGGTRGPTHVLARQPSGLRWTTAQETVYVLDSDTLETQAVARRFGLPTGKVALFFRTEELLALAESNVARKVWGGDKGRTQCALVPLAEAMKVCRWVWGAW